jgi:hypothetical protein
LVKSFQQRRDFVSGQRPSCPTRRRPPFFAGAFLTGQAGSVGLEAAVGEQRDLQSCAKTAVQHRGEGLEGRVATTTTASQRAEHAAQHSAEDRATQAAATEAAAAQEARVATEAAEATGAPAKLTREAAETGESAEAAAGATETAAWATEATLLEALLEAGLIRILGAAEAAASLLQASLEACLVRIHSRLNAAVLREALLEAGLEGVLAHLAHTREAATHHLLHLSKLLLHLS